MGFVANDTGDFVVDLGGFVDAAVGFCLHWSIQSLLPPYKFLHCITLWLLQTNLHPNIAVSTGQRLFGGFVVGFGEVVVEVGIAFNFLHIFLHPSAPPTAIPLTHKVTSFQCK